MLCCNTFIGRLQCCIGLGLLCSGRSHKLGRHKGVVAEPHKWDVSQRPKKKAILKMLGHQVQGLFIGEHAVYLFFILMTRSYSSAEVHIKLSTTLLTLVWRLKSFRDPEGRQITKALLIPCASRACVPQVENAEGITVNNNKGVCIARPGDDQRGAFHGTKATRDTWKATETPWKNLCWLKCSAWGPITSFGLSRVRFSSSNSVTWLRQYILACRSIRFRRSKPVY